MAGVCLGQSPQPAGQSLSLYEIKLPRWVKSESVFVRYQLVGEQVRWLASAAPWRFLVFHQYDLSRARPIIRIKALLYAQGCAIQTFDLPFPGLEQSRILLRLPTTAQVSIAGDVTPNGPLSTGAM